MKKIHLVLLILMAGFFVACSDSASESSSDGDGTETTANETTPAAAVAYNIDTENAKVMFLGSKDEGQHVGTFGLPSGSIELNDAGLTGGTATIDISAMTIEDADLPDEMKEKLKGHLSSEDFFNVAEHPNATITIKGSEAYSGSGEVAPEGLNGPMAEYFVTDPTHTVMASLNVKGETHDINFPAKIVKNDDGTVSAMAFVTFDRREYGLRFMSDTESTVHPEVHVGLNFGAAEAAM